MKFDLVAVKSDASGAMLSIWAHCQHENTSVLGQCSEKSGRNGLIDVQVLD